ncbi:YjfB family protein [Alkalihalophilus marmarensis]|uniref:YjfB family protein n=1 Tax=Alkalihalophilus marmarensis TaxID=521377 RepID=UPI002DB92BCA|nr:YjfB family protein [Alkalihalophilus marmarensis]MEC2071259.1 YjfB family protein [Alkalihalophilus marmarensis]
MDIALLSMALNQGQVQQQASMAVMKKAMGSAEQQGEALQKLMNSADAKAIQQAAQPHLGSTIDLSL